MGRGKMSTNHRRNRCKTNTMSPNPTRVIGCRPMRLVSAGFKHEVNQSDKCQPVLWIPVTVIWVDKARGGRCPGADGLLWISKGPGDIRSNLLVPHTGLYLPLILLQSSCRATVSLHALWYTDTVFHCVPPEHHGQRQTREAWQRAETLCIKLHGGVKNRTCLEAYLVPGACMCINSTYMPPHVRAHTHARPDRAINTAWEW